MRQPTIDGQKRQPQTILSRSTQQDRREQTQKQSIPINHVEFSGRLGKSFDDDRYGLDYQQKDGYELLTGTLFVFQPSKNKDTPSMKLRLSFFKNEANSKLFDAASELGAGKQLLVKGRLQCYETDSKQVYSIVADSIEPLVSE